ncbi:hypothetical protein A1507_18810 [Methylomonas koyamae]|uniref:Uncharacterized protein n=1 Tax=Methylomonas koyamae TaxID=702114 RepID=A0A177N3T5_9GAMM|nr:hypothetical protein [Methylomonas koyamae]OAI12636.1 hypothetical protein A1507_18810 [Methylomonas koyamae]
MTTTKKPKRPTQKPQAVETLKQPKTEAQAEPSLPTPPRQIVTVNQLAKMVTAYQGKPGAIRWQLFNSASNGLKESGAIIRNGRRILIDVENYFAWQAGNREAA